MCATRSNSWLLQITIDNERTVNDLQIKKSFQAVNKNEGKKHQVLADKLQMEKETKSD